MKRIAAVLLVLAFTANAFAVPADFIRIRKGDGVHVIVVSTGNECNGKVVARTETELTVKLDGGGKECGATEFVTVSQSNLRITDPQQLSGAKKVAGAGAAGLGAAGVLRGAGALGAAGSPAGALFLAFGGLAAGGALVHHLARKSHGYVLYCSKLEPADFSPAATSKGR